MTKLLIIGGGGREHALAWKLKQSPKVGQIFIAPGNAGTAELGENVNIKATDVLALADFAEKNKIDFTVVGPDDALALGVVDEFQKRGLKIWGPSKQAAQIEWSKAFSKELMAKNNIPTAEFKTFTDYNKALEYIEKHFNHDSSRSRPSPNASEGERRDLSKSKITDSSLVRHLAEHSLGMEQDNSPIVIKASGLALGKGVTVCKTLDEAKQALKEAMVDKVFGDSGNQVVIEEFMTGIEFSVHAFCDGKNFKLLPTSQDHKTVFDDDKGPNTGGMGTIAPLPWVTDELMNEIAEKIIKPTLSGLRDVACPFMGLLYPGLMLTKDGPKVIEFNARFGDPETQSYMRLLKTDLLDILEACVDGKLNEINVQWENKFACCIALASGGYPGKYEKGFPITGIEEAEKMDDVIVFHAGTAVKDGKLVTNGGRVVGVTAIGNDLKSALDKAYSAIKLINFEGMHYRTDIGQKSLPKT